MNHNSADSRLLFLSDGLPIYVGDIRNTLVHLGASDCDVLYIHSGMGFGIPNPRLKSSEILEIMAGLLYSLNVKSLLMPTYTFSFCEGAAFNVESSKTSMGSLNEYLRSKHGWLRSVDPLMSNIHYGQEKSLIEEIGKESVGKQSTFDLLTQSDCSVKFCFLGPRIHSCFTYMHFLEWELGVPYRYNYHFSGIIQSGTSEYEDTYTLFIRDAGVEAGDGSLIFENMLVEKLIAKRSFVGNGAITVTDLKDTRILYRSLLDLSPSFFIRDIFRQPTRSAVFERRRLLAL